MEDEEIRLRIDSRTATLMMTAAYVVYAINFVLELTLDWTGIGEIISPIFMALAYIGFAFWFTSKGVKVLSSQYFLKFVVSAVISLIPILNLFFITIRNGLPSPGIVSTIKGIIEKSQEEDRGAGEEAGEKAYSRQGFRRDRTPQADE